MSSLTTLLPSSAATLLFISGAVAFAAPATPEAQAPARVRGTVTAIAADSITVVEREGRKFTLKTGPDTVYAVVVPSSLDAIKVNDFVGTAVKAGEGSMVAVELAIIPENMRAGRISFYKWDPLPDPTASRASDATTTNMVNGLVSNVTPSALKAAATAGEGRVVSADNASTAGRTLTVTYDGGSKTFSILVPPNAPIVRYVLSDEAAAVIGSSVMVKTDPGNRAGLITIGKGVVPPM